MDLYAPIRAKTVTRTRGKNDEPIKTKNNTIVFAGHHSEFLEWKRCSLWKIMIAKMAKEEERPQKIAQAVMDIIFALKDHALAISKTYKDSEIITEEGFLKFVDYLEEEIKPEESEAAIKYFEERTNQRYLPRLKGEPVADFIRRYL